MIIDPPTGTMGYGNVRLTLKLAEARLARYGISLPTSRKLSAVPRPTGVVWPKATTRSNRRDLPGYRGGGHTARRQQSSAATVKATLETTPKFFA